MARLTKGPIISSLLKLAAPIVLANFLHMAYQLIDTFWVGRLGAEAVAALSLAFPIYFLLFSIAFGFGAAGTILVSQYKGQKDHKKLNYVATQTLTIMGVLSIVIAAVSYPFIPFILNLMGAAGNVHIYATQYIRILLLGFVFQFILSVFESVMRGVGDAKTPFYLVLGAVILNAILDPFFILGWGPIPAFGVAGAAWVTVILFGVAAAIAMSILLSQRYDVRVNFKKVRLDWKLYKKIFTLGLPTSLESVNRALGFAIMVMFASWFGVIATAAYGVGVRILSLVIIPALGFSVATGTMVGQNIGANKLERAERVANTSMWLGFGGTALISVVVAFFAPHIAAFFVPGEAEVIQQASFFIRTLSVSFSFVAIQMVVNAVFRAAGLTRTPMVFAFIQHWFLRIPIVLLLMYFGWEQASIWIGWPIASALLGFVALGWYLRGSWKRRRITDDVALQGQAAEEAEQEMPNK